MFTLSSSFVRSYSDQLYNRLKKTKKKLYICEVFVKMYVSNKVDCSVSLSTCQILTVLGGILSLPATNRVGKSESIEHFVWDILTIKMIG